MIRHEVAPAWGTIYLTLEDMRLAELISPNPYPSIGMGNVANGYSWIDQQPVYVHLRQKGLEALEAEKNKGIEDRLRQSMIETNESILATNTAQQRNIKTQEKLTKTALWIAAAAAFISLSGIFKDFLSKSDKPTILVSPQTDSILKSTGKRIEALNRTLQSLDSTLKERKTDALKTK